MKDKKKRKKQGNFLYDFVKVTGALPVLLWMRPKVIRVSKKKCKSRGVLISSNHLSFFDPIMIHCVFWNRRLNCLATKDLYSTKLKSFFFNKMHCIQVDKENFSLNSFHAVTERLGEGKAVVIFPEGQLNNDAGAVLGFKSGVVLMAHKSGAPIIPVYMPKHEKWYRRRVAVVGEAVDISALCGDRPTLSDLERASEHLRECELRLKAFYEEKYPRRKSAEDEEKVPTAK